MAHFGHTVTRELTSQLDIRTGGGFWDEQATHRLSLYTMSSATPNIYAYHSRFVLSQYHARHKNIPEAKLSDLEPLLDNPKPTVDLPVCIIGAGMAGLYTAMIFESLGIPYRIVDANTKKRVGGRVFTHHFEGGGPYDYYVSRIHMY